MKAARRSEIRSETDNEFDVRSEMDGGSSKVRSENGSESSPVRSEIDSDTIDSSGIASEEEARSELDSKTNHSSKLYHIEKELQEAQAAADSLPTLEAKLAAAKVAAWVTRQIALRSADPECVLLYAQ